jgi:cysteine desulfuration protein SufE
MSEIDARADALREDFAWLDDWEARYQHVIDLGKANPPLAPHERNEETRVRGCASQVWLVTARCADHLHVRAESDAVIVSGLIAILVRLFDGAPAAAIAVFDTEGFFEEIGVTGALTQQRANGLAAMIARVRNEARALSA